MSLFMEIFSKFYWKIYNQQTINNDGNTCYNNQQIFVEIVGEGLGNCNEKNKYTSIKKTNI